jgi:hypothetical protein
MPLQRFLKPCSALDSHGIRPGFPACESNGSHTHFFALDSTRSMPTCLFFGEDFAWSQ